MTIKNSEAKKRYWASLSPEVRSAIFKERSMKMWAKRTVEQRKEQGRKMREVRKLSTETILKSLL